MAKTWFPHEDPLEEGETSKPLFGPRFSPFWLFAMFFVFASLIMLACVSCAFVFSRPPSA
jgi:hypothetical protein